MLKLVLSICIGLATLAFVPMHSPSTGLSVFSEANAKANPPVKKKASTGSSARNGVRPNTRALRPPQRYIDNVALVSGQRARAIRDARLQSGRSLSQPGRRVRGTGARGGSVNPRGTVPGRNATSNRGGRGTGRGEAASRPRAAQGKPWSYYNRNAKRVAKRKPNGLNVTFRSSKAQKKERPASTSSVASERLQRFGRTPGGQLTVPGPGAANNAANVLRARELNSPARNIQVLPSPPKTERVRGQTTRHGRTKKFHSTKK